MKRGDTVAVCYDGKYSRRVPGVITATRQSKLKVRFHRWAGDEHEVIETWFPRRAREKKYGGRPFYHAKFVQTETPGVLHFLGCPGEWYSVWPVREGWPDETDVKVVVRELLSCLSSEHDTAKEKK